MDSSIFAFATDLDDEGVPAVLDNIGRRADAGGVTLAVAYHEGRDILPHGRRRVRFLEGGAVFFPPQLGRFSSLRLQPEVSALASRRNIVAETVEASRQRGMAVHAWAVLLHNGTLAAREPSCAPCNAFGDRYLTDLCPANPDVRAYVVALAGNIAALGVESVFAESLHHSGLEHGYAHERYLVSISAVNRLLLGLCFCDHCRAAADARDIDADSLRAAVADRLDASLGAGVDPEEAVDEESIRALFNGDLGRYLAAREEVVSSLVAAVADAVRREGNAQLTILDMSGAALGYATGRPSGPPAPTLAWQFGLDLASAAAAGAALAAMGYAQDADRVRGDLSAYAGASGGAPLELALRPWAPDCDGAPNLASKVRAARDAGVRRLHFYHYGLLPLAALDRIAAGLAGN